jgi:hypothetical protein
MWSNIVKNPLTLSSSYKNDCNRLILRLSKHYVAYPILDTGMILLFAAHGEPVESIAAMAANWVILEFGFYLLEFI